MTIQSSAINNPQLWPKPSNPVPKGQENNPNVQALQQFFAAYAKNDLEGIRAVIADDVEWHIPGHHPLSGTKKGIDEIIAFFAKLQKAGFKSEVMIMAANDHYVIDAHRGYGSFNGETLDINWILLYQFKNRKIYRVQNFSGDQYASDAFFESVYEG